MTSAANQAKDDIEILAENAGRYARKIFDQSQHMGEGAESVIAAIRNEPVKASLIALGCGILLGMIIRR